jgi:arabinogalactan endo-1,4-beta-galactosidase
MQIRFRESAHMIAIRRRFIFWFLAAAFSARVVQSQDYAVGADVSFLGQAEQQGTVFKDSGTGKAGLEILKAHGYNWVRLRLFHTPAELPNNLEYTIALAKNAKKLGFKFLLDYHYADDWADPGKQPLPKAWQGKSHAELVRAVTSPNWYTRVSTAWTQAGATVPAPKS